MKYFKLPSFLIALLMLFQPIQTKAEETPKNMAMEEMLYEGELIDPKCIFALGKKSPSVDLTQKCPEFSGDGFSPISKKLVHEPNGAYGYDFAYKDGITGGYYYKVIGKIDEGIVLKIYYSLGGSGHWSYLAIYKRNNSTLHLVRPLGGGDRCWGGINKAKIENGHVLYSYYTTPAFLYQRYIPDAPFNTALGSGFISCGAIMHMRDDTLEKVELLERANFSKCFEEEYKKQVALKKILSDEEARALMQRLSKECPDLRIK